MMRRKQHITMIVNLVSLCVWYTKENVGGQGFMWMYGFGKVTEYNTNNKMYLISASLHWHECHVPTFDPFTKPHIIFNSSLYLYSIIQSAMAADHPQQTMEYFVLGEHLAWCHLTVMWSWHQGWIGHLSHLSLVLFSTLCFAGKMIYIQEYSKKIAQIFPPAHTNACAHKRPRHQPPLGHFLHSQ